MRIGNVCTETRCYALHNNFQALVLPCHKGCVGCACCAAYQPTHRFVVAWRQDPNLGKSVLALTPILQWGQIVLFTAFASEGKEGVTYVRRNTIPATSIGAKPGAMIAASSTESGQIVRTSFMCDVAGLSFPK